MLNKVEPWNPNDNAHPDSTFESDWMRTPYKPSAAKAADKPADKKETKPADKKETKPAAKTTSLAAKAEPWNPNYNAHEDSTYESDWMRMHPSSTKTASSKDAKPAAKAADKPADKKETKPAKSTALMLEDIEYPSPDQRGPIP